MGALRLVGKGRERLYPARAVQKQRRVRLRRQRQHALRLGKLGSRARFRQHALALFQHGEGGGFRQYFIQFQFFDSLFVCHKSFRIRRNRTYANDGGNYLF